MHAPQQDLSVTSSPFWGDRLHLEVVEKWPTVLLYCIDRYQLPRRPRPFALCIIPTPSKLLHRLPNPSFPAKHLLVPRELSTCLDLRRDQRWPGPPPTRSLPTHAPPSQHANARHAYGLYPPDCSIAPPSANTMPQTSSNKVASPPPSKPQSTCSQMAPCNIRRVQWALIP